MRGPASRAARTFAFAAVMALLALARPVAAQGLNWSITTFDAEIDVRADGALDVTETIVADFTLDAHHGIFRRIPYAYRRGGTDYRLRISVKDVTDGQGRPLRFHESREKGALVLRIGDAHTLLQAPTTYAIHYTVQRALLGFDNHDELYWNVTGDEWPVPMLRARARIHFPKALREADAQLASFEGPRGSRNPGPPGRVGADGDVRFEGTGVLPPWTGLTIVVGFPKGLVAAPDTTTYALWFIRDNFILLAPFVVFTALWLLWRAFGRDLGQPGSIVVQYAPPDGLTPGEVGTLIDERIDMRDLTGSIFGLAVRGYLTIDAQQLGRRSRTDDAASIRLVRTSRPADDLKAYESRMLRTIFASGTSVSLSELETKFFPALPALKNDLYRGLANSGYFQGHLGRVRGGWMGVGIIAAVLCVIAGILLAANDVFAPLSTMVAMALSAPLFPIFARIMPRKTAKGRRAVEGIKGLEEYIARAELQELEEASRRAQFESLLPYAMVLNLSSQWARKFEGLYSQPPEWYHAPMSDAFTTWWLVDSLMRTNRAMSGAFLTAPRTATAASSHSGWTWSSGGAGGGSSGFGGGGFSGGGGGGGGGGGW